MCLYWEKSTHSSCFITILITSNHGVLEMMDGQFCCTSEKLLEYWGQCSKNINYKSMLNLLSNFVVFLCIWNTYTCRYLQYDMHLQYDIAHIKLVISAYLENGPNHCCGNVERCTFVKLTQIPFTDTFRAYHDLTRCVVLGKSFSISLS